MFIAISPLNPPQAVRFVAVMTSKADFTALEKASMLNRFLYNVDHIKEMAFNREHNAYITTESERDGQLINEIEAVQKLAEYMAKTTCPKVLESAKKEAGG